MDDSARVLARLRKPSGISDKHWRFQDYIQTPHVNNQRLVYSVTRPIPIEDADAWWIGYELIKTADRELRDVDMILRDANKQPFAVHGVAGANDPIRLKRYIRTVDWEPVSTEISVSNVASLVRNSVGLHSTVRIEKFHCGNCFKILAIRSSAPHHRGT